MILNKGHFFLGELKNQAQTKLKCENKQEYKKDCATNTACQCSWHNSSLPTLLQLERDFFHLCWWLWCRETGRQTRRGPNCQLGVGDQPG